MPVESCSPAKQAIVNKLVDRKFTQTKDFPREVRLERPSDGRCGVALVRGEKQTPYDVWELGTKVTEQKRVISINAPQRAYTATQTVNAIEAASGDIVVESKHETKYKGTLVSPFGETIRWTESLKVSKDGALTWSSTGDGANSAGFSLTLHEEK